MQLTKSFEVESREVFSNKPYKIELAYDGSIYQPTFVACGPYNTFVVAEKKWSKEKPSEGAEAFGIV